MTPEEAVEVILLGPHDTCEKCENGVKILVDESAFSMNVDVCFDCCGSGLLLRKEYLNARAVLGLPPVCAPTGLLYDACHVGSPSINEVEMKGTLIV